MGKERDDRTLFPPYWAAVYAALMVAAWAAYAGLGVVPWVLLLFATYSGLDWLVTSRGFLPLRGLLVVAFLFALLVLSGGGNSPLWAGLIPVAGGLGAATAKRRWATHVLGAILAGYTGLAIIAGVPPAILLFRLGVIGLCALFVGVIVRRVVSQMERAEASERSLRALLQAAQGITRELAVEATLGSILDRVVELLNVERAAILLEEPETGELRVAATKGITPSEWPKDLLARRGPLAAEVMERGRPKILSEGGGLAIAPLAVGEEKLGMLVVSDRKGRPLSVEDLEILRLFGTFAAVAIYKARAHRRTEDALRRSEEKAGRLRSIAEIGRRISLAATLDKLVEEALDGVCGLGYEGCAVLLAQAGEPKHLKVAGAKGILAGLSKEAKVDLLASTTGRNLREGKTVLIRDVEHVKEPEVRALFKPLGARSLLLIPILVHEEIEGALEVASTRPDEFDDEDVAEMEMVAAFVASGLEDVEMHVELRKRAEELERAYEELQRSQEQLIRAARLATVGELAAIVAHELNNPLTAILGYAQLAMGEVEDGNPLKEDLKVIESEALRTREIVRRLLDFAREVRPRRVKFNLNDVVEESIKMLAYELEASNIKVEKDLDRSLPMIVADPSQLKQVFTNMIVNAKDAMEPKGGGTLKVVTRQKEPGWVEVEISDTGVGIPPEHLARIFDPFFTTKEPGKGTGLGLTVCHRVVSQHGGRIEVESEVGKGTTFRVILPLGGEEENDRE